MFYSKNRITNYSYSPLLKTNMFNHVPIKHKQMSFVSNGGKFKLYTVPKCLLFQHLLNPGFHLNARYLKI
jgi:hypothetical protein